MEKRIFAIASLLALLFLVLFPLVHRADALDMPVEFVEARYTYKPDRQVPVERPQQDVGIFTMTSTVTAYCTCVECCGEWSAEHPSRIGTDYEQLTASGTVPRSHWTIAVDPDVIPLGSYVMIGNGVYVAEDTGSGVNGNHIDIYMTSHEDAEEFGTREMEVKVYGPERFAMQ